MTAPQTIESVSEFGCGVHALAPASAGSSEVRDVFRRYAASVGALCAMVDGEPVGIVATSLAVGISFDPPMITFSIRKASTTWPKLRKASHIGVSVLAENQGAICRQISGPAAERFTGFGLHESPEGAVFLKDAMSWLLCTVTNEVDCGDHVIIVLGLVEVGHDRESAPLIYLDGKFYGVGESTSS